MSEHDENPVEMIRRAIETLRDRAASEKPVPPGEPAPDVARAMADLLEDALEAHLSVRPGNYPSWLVSLRLARVYLGEAP